MVNPKTYVQVFFTEVSHATFLEGNARVEIRDSIQILGLNNN